ncbi:SDR family oxidoreductase [Actinomadura hibisca]|uniref:SDR family oxidoreductase n=1 Tax=Actinomadura hibisca TaxID=68565 RepID=UPI000A7DD866|nr:SDR family oxidoreductase [Actinomadura hibisca]
MAAQKTDDTAAPGTAPGAAPDVAPGVDLTGRTAVVTGALGRLGPVWAGALLGAGARVVGLDLSADVPAPLDAALDRHGHDRFLLLKADVTERADLAAALAECLSTFGPPTVLVNNAGIDQPPSADGESWRFGDIPGEVSAGILDVNALGTLRACQVFGTDMAERGHGSIVNIGSLYAGMAPDPRLYEHLAQDPPFLKPPAYGMSKAGVCALSRYLAALWGRRGVRVNTLSPGGVLGGQDRRFRELFGARTPMGRMADTTELTGPLLFLASDLSGYVTGTELLVDGGYSCW